MYGLNKTVLMRTSIVLPSALMMVIAIAACKPIAAPEQSETSSLDSNSADLETLTARENTTLKSSLLQSSGLGAGEICPIPQGTILSAESLKAEGIDHWRITGLIEIKLPTGEVGRVARQSNEQPVAQPAGQSSGQATELAAGEASGPTSEQPTGQSSTVNPSGNETSSQPVLLRTPAELLNCELLKKDSFLVYSKHFNRALVRSPGAKNSQVSRESAGGDDGVFVWPTRGRKIRNDAGGLGHYGAPRGRRGHQGIDIVAAVGEPIYAARAGTIVDPAYEYSYGKVVDVKHEEGYMTRYAHLTSFSYSHGAYVEKGDKIAAAGRTGNAAGGGIIPHLHFEVRQYGRLLNPMKVLP